MSRHTVAARRDRVTHTGRFRRRLTIAFVLVAGASAAALAAGAYTLFASARLADSLSRAESDVRFQLVVAREFLPLNEDGGARLLASFEDSGRHVVLVQAGLPVASNPSFDPPLSAGLRSAVTSGQIGYERQGSGGHHLLVVGGRIPGSAAELYVVQVEDGLREDLTQLATALLGGWIAVVAVAGLAGSLIARRTLAPVARASDAARAVAGGLLDTRLAVEGRDEFGAWAASFNRMAEALEAKLAALTAAQERERRFTADVAHELRTPVTALVAAASVLADSIDRLPADARRPAELLVGDVLRLRHLVEDLMEISRLSSAGQAIRAERLDLTALVSTVLTAHGWAGTVRLEAGAVYLTSDPRRLERMVANLVGNAVEHGAQAGTEAGSGIAVRLEQAGQWVCLSVTDNGPGIPAEHLPHLFERFYKVDPARTGGGSGLGLAIVGENVRLLGGAIVVTSQVGAGTRVLVRLPSITGPDSVKTVTRQ